MRCSVVSQLSTVGTEQALHLSWCTTCGQLINNLNLPAPILFNLGNAENLARGQFGEPFHAQTAANVALPTPVCLAGQGPNTGWLF